MSTQIRFSDCDAERWSLPRPDLAYRWFAVGQNPHTAGRDACSGKDPPRRFDRLPQSYGAGVPTLQTATTDRYGLHQKVQQSYQVAQTQEGPMNVPVHFQQSHYTPSVAALDALTHTSDTRLQAHPPRYYR